MKGSSLAPAFERGVGIIKFQKCVQVRRSARVKPIDDNPDGIVVRLEVSHGSIPFVGIVLVNRPGMNSA